MEEALFRLADRGRFILIGDRADRTSRYVDGVRNKPRTVAIDDRCCHDCSTFHEHRWCDYVRAKSVCGE